VTLLHDLQTALGPTTTLRSELPRGGMARVFDGFDETLQRRIAVKVLAPDLDESLSVERFRREIMLVASLQHPNIVPVLSAGDVDGLPYFVMPFVEGESLRSRLMRGPLSVRETINIMRDVARALTLAHQHGIVHRDIKPDNVMLTGGVATVTDFGVAKALAAARKRQRTSDPGAVDLPTITTAGTAIGTPAYMAPEQATGDPRTDHRADLYSLGILGYEMLCGAPPFRGRSTQQLMAAQLAGTPTPIEKRRADVPEELRALIMRCLEKEADARPKTATGVVRVLENPDLLSGAFAAPKPTRLQRSRRQTRIAWAAIVLASLAAVTYMMWPAGSPRAAVTAPTVQATVLVPTFQSPPRAPDDSVRARVIAEQIAAGLARVPGLRVAGPPMADSIARAPVLDTAATRPRTLTLDGRLQRTANQTRLSVRLVDDGGFTVWGNTFGFSDPDPLALQDRLSSAVLTELVRTLRTRLGLPDSGSAPPR
jgi:tRNA A-37 threonylcarbamoyl transferase component Bud32/TolB-like protein